MVTGANGYLGSEIVRQLLLDVSVSSELCSSPAGSLHPLMPWVTQSDHIISLSPTHVLPFHPVMTGVSGDRSITHT